jgi:mycothiol synthase
MRAHPYRDVDLPRLQAALAGWIAAAGACGYGHIGELPHRIYTNRHERHAPSDLVRYWEEDDAIVGIAIHFRFESTFDVLVAPALRGSGREVEMLRAAYEATRSLADALGREDATVGTDAYGCDGARREALARLGFVEYRRWDDVTERPLDDAIPEPQLPDGFAIRPATLEDFAQLAAVRNDAFGDAWSPEQYRDGVMCKPGYHPERELVVVAPGGEIAAFTVTWLDPLNRVGLFEPVGTRPAFQRRGLARALLLAGLREMRRHGMETAMVAHDTTNRPAGELYRGLGFRTKYETLGYRPG